MSEIDNPRNKPASQPSAPPAADSKPKEPVYVVGGKVKFRGESAVVRRVESDGKLTVEWTEKKAASGDPGYFEHVDASEVEVETL